MDYRQQQRQHPYFIITIRNAISFMFLYISTQQIMTTNASFVTMHQKKTILPLVFKCTKRTTDHYHNRNRYAIIAKAVPDENSSNDEKQNENVGVIQERTDDTIVKVGDVVFAKTDIPSEGIYRDVGYDVVDIYHQGLNEETGRIERIQVQNLEVLPPRGYKLYLKLYSPTYHRGEGSNSNNIQNNAVIVTPEEVGLVTVKYQLIESLMLAIPGLFWVGLCITFINFYNDRFGGNFMDALLGT